jgi:site-specific recombinase XerD
LVEEIAVNCGVAVMEGWITLVFVPIAGGVARCWKLGVGRSADGGPLSGLMGGFAAELERQGYAPATAGPYLWRFELLSCWMQVQGLGLEDVSRAMLERFCEALRAAGYRNHVSISGVKPMLAYLCQLGLGGSEGPQPTGPVEELLDRFAGWMERERDLAPSSVQTYLRYSRPLLERLVVGDRVAVECLDAVVVRRFVLDVCPGQGRASAKLTVVAVRQLLVFLYAEGELERPLRGAVPSVAGYRLSGLPKRLGSGEVQRNAGCL